MDACGYGDSNLGGVAFIAMIVVIILNICFTIYSYIIGLTFGEWIVFPLVSAIPALTFLSLARARGI